MVTDKNLKHQISRLSSNELRYNHYKPPFPTIAFILRKNIIQIESIWAYANMEK